MARKLIGTVAGILAANLVIYGWDWLLAHVGATATVGADGVDEATLLHGGSALLRAGVVAGWTLGAGAGALLAFIVARSDWTGWIVAGWVAALALAGAWAEPLDVWLGLAAVALPFVGALFGFGLYRRWRAARLHLHPRQP